MRFEFKLRGCSFCAEFTVGEKVIWVITAARKNREGYQSVGEGRGRAEIFAEVAAVGPKRIQSW